LTFAQRSLKSKVKLNFGLSPDFGVQLKVSLSEWLSERLSQKLVTHWYVIDRVAVGLTKLAVNSLILMIHANIGFRYLLTLDN